MKVFDLHNDVLTEVKNYKKEILNYPNNYKIITAVYRGNRTFKEVITLLDNYSLLKSKNTRLAFEDIGYNDLNFNKLLSYKPTYCSLTHNKENLYGYGVDINLDIKEKGKDAIKKLNENNIPLDLSHLSQKGCYSAIKLANRVLFSHVAFSGIYPHKRNICDGLIKEVLAKNGIIGLTFVGYFLADKNADIYSVIKHVDYFLSRFGDDNLSIGSDFNGTDYLPKNLKNYVGFYNLKKELIKCGYSKNTIEKIFYKNANKFFEDNKML